MKEEMLAIARAFDIPVVNKDKRIWFFRTQGGDFYNDFYLNCFVALGWDEISIDYVRDKNINYQEKQKKVKELYPRMYRPSHALGQIRILYDEMQAGDLVVIPAISSKKIAIGILGEIKTSIEHAITENDYLKCDYGHIRSVKWLKQIDLWSDVYLFRVLRAHQTVTNISHYDTMIYRNLYSIYISNDGIHLTLKKRTESDYSVADNVSLLSAMLSINEALSDYFGVPDEQDKIKMKTAVGSPGFIEIIKPIIDVTITTPAINIPVDPTVMTIILIALLLIGTGTIKEGLISKILGWREKIADVALKKAEEKRKDAETEAIKTANKKEKNQLDNDIATEKIENACAKLIEAADRIGIQKGTNEEAPVDKSGS